MSSQAASRIFALTLTHTQTGASFCRTLHSGKALSIRGQHPLTVMAPLSQSDSLQIRLPNQKPVAATDGTHTLGDYRINVQSFLAPERITQVPAWTGNINDTAPRKLDAQDQWMRRGLSAGLSTCLLLALSSIFLPGREVVPESQLLPPQVAKIILKRKKVAPSATASTAQNTPSKDSKSNNQLPPEVAKQVAQVAQSKAIRNSVKGLMKGGMAKFLSNVKALEGASPVTLGSQLGKSPSLAQVSQTGSGTATRGLASAAPATTLGGTYSAGTETGSKNQGKSFVSLDLNRLNVEEGLSKDEVGKIIHAHISEVRYCYESALLKNNSLEGKVQIDFVITGVGQVKTAQVSNSNLGDDRLDDCIVRRLTSWKFPNPKGGVEVAVSYPFILKSLGR